MTTLLLMGALVLSETVPAPNLASWRYERLDLDVHIEPARSRLEVHGVATLTLSGAPSSDIRFFVNTRAPSMTVERFATTHDNAQIGITTSGAQQLVHVALGGDASPGDTVRVEFALSMAQPSSQLIVRDSIALASWVEAWYPVLVGGAPGGGALWAAPGTTRFHLPDDWHGVANGAPAGGAHEWHTDVSVNRSFTAAPYRVTRTTAGGREIAVYLLSADTASARRQAESLSRAITAMEAVWGPYPYAGYAIAEVPDGTVTWAASSEQGFIMATSSQFGDDGNLPLFAHEAAHAWWGNTVRSMGPGAQLVTESLAQYGAVVAIEAIEGVDAMNEFLRFSRRGYNRFQSASGYFEIIRRGGDKPLSQLANDTWDHNLSDSKGHWFYHMLRHRFGSDRFFAILRDVQRDHAGRALPLAELRRILIAAAPEDDGLERFIAQWLDRTGAPHLDTRWWTTDEGRGVHLEVVQLQPSLYELDLTVELELVNGQRTTQRVRLDAREHTFAFEAHARVVGLVLDPGHHLLFWRPEYGAPVETR
jgi:hypothetical protein